MLRSKTGSGQMPAAALMALMALVRLVLASARMKRIARRLLQAAPGMQARLQLMMYQAALPRRAGAASVNGKQLSPRALQLHSQLMRARSPQRSGGTSGGT